MEIKYYEAFFNSPFNPIPDDVQPAMCIKGIRKPSLEEANFFLRSECAGYARGMNVTEIHEISQKDAAAFYDLSNEANWPVFGLDNPGWFKSREELSEHDHKTFVDMWFANYETTGFLETFQSPYEQFQDRNGQKFTVIARVPDFDCDLECLPKWIIRFEDGYATEGYPEEICKIEK